MCWTQRVVATFFAQFWKISGNNIALDKLNKLYLKKEIISSEIEKFCRIWVLDGLYQV